MDQPEDLRAVRHIHKTLADVNRLRIVRRLAQGEASVNELIDHVGLSQPLVSWHLGKLRLALSQPLVSWHLGKLRLAGLVETRRAGRETVTRLIPEAWDRFATYERRVLGISPADAPWTAAS